MENRSVRAWIEALLDGSDDARREALPALAAAPNQAALEAVKLAIELEGDGPFAEMLAQTRTAISKTLGLKAAAMAADRVVQPFRTPESRFRPLALTGTADGARSYLAVQLGVRRLVSLRVLDGEAGTNGASPDRYLAGARALGRAAHPHVAAVFDTGVLGNKAYIVSELVEGASLRALVEAGGPFEWREALRAAREVASALGALHAVGVAHRQISAATILMEEGDRVKLAVPAPAAGSASPAGVSQDLVDVVHVLHELLSGQPVSATGPRPELGESVPADVAKLVDRRGLARAGGLASADALVGAIDEALSAVEQAAKTAAEQKLADALETARLADPTASAPPPPKRRMLVVDDDPNTLTIASVLLAPSGFVAKTAASPEDALRVLMKEKFDVILTDLHFPGDLSGVDLVTALRRNDSALPVVAMSASEEVEVWEQVLRAGVSAIVAKPLDITELVAVVERAASRRRPGLLVVDESALARRIFKRFFENRGFAVTEVHSLQSARDAIEALVPAVIVTDVALPDGSGLDILEHVGRHYPGVRVILLAAAPSAEDVIRAFRSNVVDFVSKSEDPRHLLRAVERIVTPHRRAGRRTLP